MSAKDRKKDFEKMMDKGRQTRADDNLVAAAKRVINEQQQMIDQLTEPGIALPRPAEAKTDGGCNMRVVVADMHGSRMAHEAVAAFLGDMEMLQPRDIVMLGDMVDCGGFLAEHHVIGYVSETEYSYAEDIAVLNEFLDKIQDASQWQQYIMGNHERRVDRWCVTTAQKMRSDRRMVMDALLDSFSVERLAHLRERGIDVVRQGEVREGEFVPATVHNGKSVYCHNAFDTAGGGGQSAAKKHIQKFQTNVAYAHTHRAEQVILTNGSTGEVQVARNPGCLCCQQPLWNHSRPTDWTHGYDLELIDKDSGDFISLHVPIVFGRSMLSELLAVLKIK